MNQEKRRVGTDDLHVAGEEIFIDARCAMPSWRGPGRYRPVAVDWEGTRYAVRCEEPRAKGRFRYTLSVWSNLDGDSPSSVITYDENYVDSRDAEMQRGRKAAIGQFFLAPLAGLIGFLPSWFQTRLEQNLGIGARTATRTSLALEKFFTLGFGTLSLIHLMTQAVFPQSYESLPWAVPLLVIDLILRKSALDEDPPRTFGLLEWLWPPHWFPAS